MSTVMPSIHNLTNNLSLSSQPQVGGLDLVDTSRPTPEDKPFIITYDVQDSAVPPNSAKTVRRRVKMVCAKGEVTCPDPDNDKLVVCSFNGQCGLGAGPAAAPSAPVSSATPTLTVLGPNPVTVKGGGKYAKCVGSAVLDCDQGVVATLEAEGDLDKMYMWVQCSGTVLHARLLTVIDLTQSGS